MFSGQGMGIKTSLQREARHSAGSGRCACPRWLPGLLLLGLSTSAHAFDWVVNEVQYLYGTEFREPFNPDDVSKHTVTLQHADGHSLGRNFMFVDVLQSDRYDEHATEVYAEAYASLSLSKLTGREWSAGILKDVNLTAGINWGYKDYEGYTVNPRVFLPGITLDFNLPGFAFFNLDVLAYIDRGRFDGEDNGCHGTTWQINPVWNLPFSAGGEKFSFEGYVNFTGANGACRSNTLAQPQLRWDVGHHFGKPDKAYFGMEYQYWRNKFGIEDLDDHVPQALFVYKF